jgi:two-component sensor histidine kinase
MARTARTVRPALSDDPADKLAAALSYPIGKWKRRDDAAYTAAPFYFVFCRPGAGDMSPGRDIWVALEAVAWLTGNPPAAAELLMAPGPTDLGAVIEDNPKGDAPEVTLRALNQRIRQQEILAELGVLALQRTSFSDLLDRTAEFTAEGLQAEFCKVLEYIPADKQLLVRAGVGWEEGIVGVASVGADLASPAGFALRTGKPVISNHLENEERFRTPGLLIQHGIRRAMNVILQGDGSPFGVLEVDSRSEGEFVEHDLAFLQGAANILGMAIERQRHERSLKSALERQGVLLKEINHRTKNSLALVSSMLTLQAKGSDDPTVVGHLQAAASRIATIARAHERLYRSDDVESLELAKYLTDLCGDLQLTIPTSAITFEASDDVKIATDRGILLALIVTELVVNAAKYAYGATAGPIRVRMAKSSVQILLTVRDDGSGLPIGFDVRRSKGLGMRIVAALATQIGATVEARNCDPGAEFAIRISLE